MLSLLEGESLKNMLEQYTIPPVVTLMNMSQSITQQPQVVWHMLCTWMDWWCVVMCMIIFYRSPISQLWQFTYDCILVVVCIYRVRVIMHESLDASTSVCESLQYLVYYFFNSITVCTALYFRMSTATYSQTDHHASIQFLHHSFSKLVHIPILLTWLVLYVSSCTMFTGSQKI